MEDCNSLVRGGHPQVDRAVIFDIGDQRHLKRVMFADVAHNFRRWGPNPFLVEPQGAVMHIDQDGSRHYLNCFLIVFRRCLLKSRPRRLLFQRQSFQVHLLQRFLLCFHLNSSILRGHSPHLALSSLRHLRPQLAGEFSPPICEHVAKMAVVTVKSQGVSSGHLLPTRWGSKCNIVSVSAAAGAPLVAIPKTATPQFAETALSRFGCDFGRVGAPGLYNAWLAHTQSGNRFLLISEQFVEHLNQLKLRDCEYPMFCRTAHGEIHCYLGRVRFIG